MKCVLIDPPMTAVNISKEGSLKEAAKQQATCYPPIGLAYIAAFLRENGVDVKIIDAKSLCMSHKEIAESVEKYAPDVAGVTVFTTQLRSALDTCKEIKEHCPSTKIIVGGAHIHPEHKGIIKEDFIDFCVRGEGEITMLELINAVSNETPLEEVRGITFKKGDDTVVTPDRPFIEDLDILPFPARDLLPNHIYQVTTQRGMETFTAFTASRGCPFTCNFCSVPKFWPYRRRRSVGNILEELEVIHEKYKTDYIRFTDEVFTANRKWVTEICKGIVERGLSEKIKFSCDGRVEHISKDMFREMKRAGCETIFYGIEFGNQRILDFAGKRTRLAQFHKAVEMTKKAGISPFGGFMFGYPTETKETIEDTITLARTLGVDEVTFTVVTPFPGTRLYQYCDENNLLRTRNWEEYNYNIPDKGIIKLDDLTNEELMKLYRRAHTEFYFRHIRDKLQQEMYELFDQQEESGVKPDNTLSNLTAQNQGLWGELH